MKKINAKEYWDDVWKRESQRDVKVYPKTYEKVLKIIGSGKDVLELGCGIGTLLEKIKDHENNVTGLDISEYAIDHIKKKGMNGLVSDLPDISLEDESFDIVLGVELFEHIEDTEELLRQSFRVCKKGGIVIFTVPNNSDASNESDEDIDIYNPNSMKKLFKDFSDTIKIEEYVDMTFVKDDMKISLDTMIIVAKKDKISEAQEKKDIINKMDVSKNYFDQGNSEKKRGNYISALSYYERALESGYNKMNTLEAIGHTYIKLKKYKDAFTVYKKLVSMRTDSPEVMNNIAALLVMNKEYEKALVFLKKALQYNHPKKELIKQNITALEKRLKQSST